MGVIVLAVGVRRIDLIGNSPARIRTGDRAIMSHEKMTLKTQLGTIIDVVCAVGQLGIQTSVYSSEMGTVFRAI